MVWKLFRHANSLNALCMYLNRLYIRSKSPFYAKFDGLFTCIKSKEKWEVKQKYTEYLRDINFSQHPKKNVKTVWHIYCNSILIGCELVDHICS